MTTNPATGLPVLPKGYFFRVGRLSGYLSDSPGYYDDKVGPYYAVQIRKRHALGLFSTCQFYKFLSFQRDFRTVFISSPRNISEKNIYDVALTLAENLEASLANEEADRAKLKLVGNYPPKKIGDPS